jgi:hypothetical protein
MEELPMMLVYFDPCVDTHSNVLVLASDQSAKQL